MSTNPSELKAQLRQRAQERLQGLNPQQRDAAATKARAMLQAQEVWKRAQIVLFFAPLRDELDVWPLVAPALAAGKIVALPRFDESRQHYSAARIQGLPGEIWPGRFGIREPREHCPDVPLDRPDFVLVPGVAFDLRGHRLGRGRGFYDRLLADMRGQKCGVSFDEQLIGGIPDEPHDIRLDYILTPTRWIEPIL